MYQALYRKWRPRTFSEVVGQTHITDTLQYQVAEGRTGHAYLFTGTRGTGKTTCARILAKAINCLSPVEGAPCNCCEACRGIDSGNLLDITELDAASNNGVDHVRALREEAVYTPAVLKKRVYIIDEVHMLSTAAFNALLKILEEPPEHLVFILATTELHKVPATILSRCQRFTFKRILPRDMERQLMQIAQAEQIDLAPDGAEILARMANGALRDALSLLDQCRSIQGRLDSRAVLDVLGLAGSIQTAQLMRCILQRSPADALMLFDQLYRGGKDVGALLGELSDLARDLTILKAAPEGGSALLSGLYDRSSLEQLGKAESLSRLLYLTDVLQQYTARLSDSLQPRTEAELCLMKLCDEALCGDLSGLIARMDRMEQAMAQGAAPAAQKQKARPSVQQEIPREEPSVPVYDEPERPPLPEEPPLPDEIPIYMQDPDPIQPSAPQPIAPPSFVSQTSASEAPADRDDRLWGNLLDQYKGRLPMHHRVFLNMASGTLTGDTLTVRCKDKFVQESLDNATVLEVLQEVTSAAVGRTIYVDLAVGEIGSAAPTHPKAVPVSQPEPVPQQSPPREDPPAPSHDKLDELIAQGSQLDHFKIK
ncbi:MAG: DNA polymerase III subunit gamma/tau [Ruminococcaceae bacterium]|nr:DNA polymerase III subunit gamma/tau [Oscillospiraceae bacterium]